MLNLRVRILAALALSLALTLSATAAPVPSEVPAGTYDKYLLDDADGIINVNVRALLDSELMKKAGLDKLLAGDEAQKTLKSLGIDPLKDIERVVIVMKGHEVPQFVIIQGKFDTAKLSAAAEAAAKENKDALKVHKAEHGKIYEIANLDKLIPLPAGIAGQGVDLKDKSLFVVIADKGNVVVTGSKDNATDVLAKAAGKKTTKLTNKELATLIGKINAKQTVSLAIPAPAGEEKIKSITGGLTVTADVKLDFTITASDADAAKELNDKIKEALDTVQGIAAALPQLAPAVDIIKAVKHEAKDNTISITGDIKGESLEKLVQAAKELAEKGGIK